MIGIADNLSLAFDSIRAHKLRASLTVLGLTMGVATLITVMTLVQGANLYVKQKIANLGTNVFRIGRLPFASTDFTAYVKAQRNRFFYPDDLEALAAECEHCQTVGASVSSGLSLRYQNKELDDVTMYGHTPNMAAIDTRTVELGRYFTDVEDRHASDVCLIGDRVAQEFFPFANPLGRVIRTGNADLGPVRSFAGLQKCSRGNQTMRAQRSLRRVWPLSISYHVLANVLSVRNSTTYRGVKNWFRTAISRLLRGAAESARICRRSSSVLKY